MSKDNEKETLLDLFSTRNRGASSTSLLEGPAATPAIRPSSRELAESNRESSGNKTGGGHRAPLSAVANAILREARKELGSKEDLTNEDEISEEAIAGAIDKVCASRGYVIDDIVRADLIVHLKKDLLGWGVLQPMIDNAEVTDVHVYDFQTIVIQRGKISETTGYGWPSHEAYCTFIDRLLFRLGKSLSTQQHTVDASFPDGKRICAVHESVCGQRGPFLTIRVPRVSEANLENLVSYQVAPPLIVNYLAALVRTCEHTFMVSGETGTGENNYNPLSWNSVPSR
jgi:pilus assembly protein CpaF